ncbi:MAG TPA: cell division protein FtsZ [Candidatus Limnocylindrales bacterium]|nr:cell division protein FtsZ [Candidatus Limnocylindrales bacterium]
MIELVDENMSNARIVVVGCGGGGGNAVTTMIKAELSGVDFLAANTDSQALATSLAPVKIQLGCSLTKGLGAGANPEVGRKAALEQEDIIREELGGADMVFVTAGMGGGTGTGAAPVIARIAKDLGALTVGVVTKPFAFEGRRRLRQAEEGIRELRGACDTLIVIPNQRLIEIASRSTTALEAFKKADDVLLHAVRGISQIITEPGTINVDFADVRTIMSEMGMAMMGHGIGYGDSRAIDAATNAISSPLLEDISINGARGVLVNITASEDFGIQELNEAVDLIQTQAHEDANIIVGLVHDANLEDEVRITVIATGFGDRLIDRLQPGHRGDAMMSAMTAPERPSQQSQRPQYFGGRSSGGGYGGDRRMMSDTIDDPYAGAEMGGAEQHGEPQRREPEMGPEQPQQEELEFAAIQEDEDQRVPAYLRRWRQRGGQRPGR